jgi:hypothetical protein
MATALSYLRSCDDSSGQMRTRRLIARSESSQMVVEKSYHVVTDLPQEGSVILLGRKLVKKIRKKKMCVA